MIVISIHRNGWTCSCTDDFYSTLTPMSAEFHALQHRRVHYELEGEEVEVRKLRQMEGGAG